MTTQTEPTRAQDARAQDLALIYGATRCRMDGDIYVVDLCESAVSPPLATWYIWPGGEGARTRPEGVAA